MSKLVTKNDLTNILNEVLPIPQGTQYELIWTNPNGNSQTSTMGASTITTNTSLSKYDGFMAEFRCYYNTGDKTYGFNMKGMSGMFSKVITVRSSGNPIIEYTRIWYPSSDTQLTISDCTRITSNSADVTGEDTGCLVPIRIWGIILKATGVSPIQEDYIVEQGTETTTDGTWNYRKWDSGYYEAWLEYGISGLNITTSSAGTYYHSSALTVNAPSFSLSIIHAQGSPRPSMSSGVFVYTVVGKTSTTLELNFRAHSSTSNAMVNCSLYIYGTWK